MPSFNDTDYTRIQIKKVREHLKSVLKNEVLNFDQLCYIPTVHDFSKLAVLPKMDLSISDERNQVLGGEGNLVE
jgi:hypothetical protein